ncbi:glycosyltransferase [Candidatus Woesearchaeota archaeon]|nr:glycosyltransferase [Candidatus Woesearchaeota archaeon]
MSIPKFTIAIPFFNEEKIISRKIENTLALDYPKNCFDVLLVDDFSNDNSLEIAKKYCSRFSNVRLVRNKQQKGKVGCVNTALSYARHDLFAITDADVMLKKDILKKAIPHISSDEIGAVCGIQNLVAKSQSHNAFSVEDSYRKFYTKLRLMESRLDSAPVFHGQFMIVKKKLMMKIGTFYDDTDIAIKIRKLGYKVKYISECVFYEESLRSIKDLSSQKERRGTGLILVMLSNRDVLFNPKYGLFGMAIYPFELGIYILQPFLFFILLFGIFIGISYVSLIYGIIYITMMIVLYITTPFLKSAIFGNLALIKSMLNIAFEGKKAAEIYLNCNWPSNRG